MTEAAIMEIIQHRLGARIDEYELPPPVFKAMQGEFLNFDADNALLKTRFPVLQQFLNPYGSMQGGMVAAAVDNTFGPLSMLVATPNVTRRLEMKYSQPVTIELGYITITAQLKERDGRWLHFTAKVYDQKECILARAKATHWILDDGTKD